MKLLIEYVDPVEGTVILREDKIRDLSSNGLHTLGVPGLKQGRTHYFRASYCLDSPAKCSCRSGRSDAITTEAFSGYSPTAPLVQLVEDAFARPDTTKQVTGGDGLGPTTVWQEIASNEGAAGRARIIQEGRADLEQGVFAWYVAGSTATGVATDQHSYVEGLYSRHSSTTDAVYNVDLLVRGVNDGMVRKGYLVKVAHDSGHEIPVPTIAVVAVNGMQNTPIGTRAIGLALGVKCIATLPLETENSTTPVWVHVEPYDSGGIPRIRVDLAWGGPNCGEDVDLETACTQYCSTSNHPEGDIKDTDDYYDLSGVYGTWGFFVHHNSYYLDHFRAGSEP